MMDVMLWVVCSAVHCTVLWCGVVWCQDNVM